MTKWLTAGGMRVRELPGEVTIRGDPPPTEVEHGYNAMTRNKRGSSPSTWPRLGAGCGRGASRHGRRGRQELRGGVPEKLGLGQAAQRG